MRVRVAPIVLALACARPKELPRVDAEVGTDHALHDAKIAVASHDALSDAAPRRESGPFGILFDAGGPSLLVYLHGMGASPEDSCSFFERAADGALLCPRGNAGPKAWAGPLSERRRTVDAALAKVSQRSGTLIGFSIGARFALDLALAEPGKWPALILMSQKLPLTPDVLEKAGVRKIVLAAGELDGSYATMRAQANALGARARFVSLGKVGHHFAVDMEAVMVDAVTWVSQNHEH